MRRSYGRLFTILFLMAIYSFIFLPSASAEPKRVAFFVNGDQNCCASNMIKTMEAFQELGIEVDYSAWNSLTAHNIGSNPSNTYNFLTTATDYFNSLPDGTEVYLIGHSFGGDSVLQLVQSYRRSRIKFRLVAILDAVRAFGTRSNTNKIPSNVDYFFNRWQKNAPWPTDLLSSGNIDCDAKDCNQENKNFSRGPNGDTRTTECEKYESCPGAGFKTGRNGLPFYYPGEKKTRLHHAFVATDPYIEEQIINITKQLVATSDIPKQFFSACIVNEVTNPISYRVLWGSAAPRISVIAPPRVDQSGVTMSRNNQYWPEWVVRTPDGNTTPPPLFVEFDSDSAPGNQSKTYKLNTWAIPIKLDQAAQIMANNGRIAPMPHLCDNIRVWETFRSKNNGRTIDLYSIQR